MTTEKRHPNDWDLYTPITPEIIALFERMKVEGDGTWRQVAATIEVRSKVLRNIFQANRKTISMRQLDKAITRTGVGNLRDYTWFTAHDLIAMGIWKPIKGDDSSVDPPS